MNYKVIDREKYYRKGVYRHFTEDCKCSVSMTARVDVTDLVKHSKETGTKFYINFLYLLTKVLNSPEMTTECSISGSRTSSSATT